MATYDNALDSAKLRAQRTNATYFIYHQPETWEDRDTGWHVIEQYEYYDGAVDIDEQTVRCSVTWDDETGYFSIEEFRHWCYSTWQDEYMRSMTSTVSHVASMKTDLHNDWCVEQYETSTQSTGEPQRIARAE